MFLLYSLFLHSNRYAPDMNSCSLLIGSIMHSKSECIIQFLLIQFFKFQISYIFYKRALVFDIFYSYNIRYEIYTLIHYKKHLNNFYSLKEHANHLI